MGSETLSENPVASGGCQCGAVRFRVKGRLGSASICHCRMCQKAFGNYFAPLVSVKEGTLEWTRGTRKLFRSSNHVQRGFCADCGTPLTYEAPDGLALSIAAFDNPQEIEPVVQWGMEGRLPYLDKLSTLPAYTTDRDPESAEFVRTMVSYQHPDHDTETWPQGHA
ncbi:GFA family protein [Pseudochrobactrum algeriensis]|uniref:GFA family protein n=1 Tax=Pseudochrobactrum algeriensis TaxID=2834768 RepID=UPI001BCBA8CE|nr:GFA family protein [Pseudochrobactrum algeriensis]MBX8813474.1 GFA family protein [Ochrobactrum sp. MR34]QVQ37675.1 GFA family protein [Pseudochrobactrum algeriensis]QVQ40895.1 GFA family protein [Pseudochrobactrum algeriensis]QVQ44819.1 GFA family protein [Pseudochrobactrum algeriensis]